MTSIEISALAIIQGITEFLPISSSAHATLYSFIFVGGSHSVLLDTALHSGSLLALLIFFHSEWRNLLVGAKDLACKKNKTKNARLLMRIVIATIPLVLLGAAIAQTNTLEELPRNPITIAITSIVCATLLLAADAKQNTNNNNRKKNIESLSLLAMLGVGLCQCFAALIPGASRAGVVMTIALIYGLSRKQAARLAILTALPALTGASILGIIEINSSLNAESSLLQAQALQQFMLAAVISFFVSSIALVLFMRAISRIGVKPFVIYRIALGLVVIIVVANS